MVTYSQKVKQMKHAYLKDEFKIQVATYTICMTHGV